MQFRKKQNAVKLENETQMTQCPHDISWQLTFDPDPEPLLWTLSLPKQEQFPACPMEPNQFKIYTHT